MTTLFVVTAVPSLGFAVGDIVTDESDFARTQPQSRLRSSATILQLLTGAYAPAFQPYDQVGACPGYKRFIGDTWAWRITVKDPSGVVVPLTDYRVSGQLILGTNVVAELNVGNGRIVLTDLPNGQFLVCVESAYTQTLTPVGSKVYYRVAVVVGGQPENQFPTITVGEILVSPQYR